jgi:hypothetical protein
MKTKTNNLKKLALTACSALVIATGTFTQPNPEVFAKVDMISLASLEALMVSTEQAIQYVAPADLGTFDATAEFGRLDVLADATETNLKYEAPAAEETANEIERLDVLVDATEVSLEYVAPEVEDAAVIEMDRLNVLADATEASLKYVAPAVDENTAVIELERLDVLADATEASLEYVAPNAEETENAVNEMMLANAK